MTYFFGIPEGRPLRRVAVHAAVPAGAVGSDVPRRGAKAPRPHGGRGDGDLRIRPEVPQILPVDAPRGRDSPFVEQGTAAGSHVESPGPADGGRPRNRFPEAVRRLPDLPAVPGRP